MVVYEPFSDIPIIHRQAIYAYYYSQYTDSITVFFSSIMIPNMAMKNQIHSIHHTQLRLRRRPTFLPVTELLFLRPETMGPKRKQKNDAIKIVRCR